MMIFSSKVWRLAAAAVLGVAFAGVLSSAQSNQKARTEHGRDVVLRPDGTWAFAPEAAPQPIVGQAPNTASGAPAARSPANGALVSAPTSAGTGGAATGGASAAGLIPALRARDATASIATRRGGFRYWYNPQKWQPGAEQADGRLQLQLIGHDVFVALIPDGAPLPLPQLRTVALENARRTDPAARVVGEQRRTLGNRDILHLEIEATLPQNNTPATYLGYYYGDPRGNIQVIAIVERREAARYRAIMTEALNGLDLNR